MTGERRPQIAWSIDVVVVAVAVGVTGVGHASVVLAVVTIAGLLGFRLGGTGPTDGSPGSGGPGSTVWLTRAMRATTSRSQH